ncbi:MAG: SDR family oxidoreductase [Flavobacteriaceae bacterium]|nr:SDR family oxidoreductase [Flavobacteriaceae bacterium]
MKKKVIIIGGSKGIGKEIANTLLPDNHVLNISRSEPSFTDERLTHFTCDVLNDELPDIDEADALIYCPGSINLKPINRLDVEDFREDFEINVIGAVKAIKKYIPILKNSEEASVVLFSTVATMMGMPFHASTAAAKSAVEGLVKSLAAEFATSIRFNAIAPTVTDTDLASKLLRNDKMIENIKERHPLKSYLDPSDVASLAEFLISDKSSKISGQVFPIDCGIVSLKV